MSDHAEDDQCRIDLSERTTSIQENLPTLPTANRSSTDEIDTGTISYELYTDVNMNRPISAASSIHPQSAGAISYDLYQDNMNCPIATASSIRPQTAKNQSRTLSNSFSEGRHSAANQMHQYYDARANRIFSESSQPYLQDPLNEIRTDILAIRKSALTVYEPLTYVWVSIICFVRKDDSSVPFYLHP
jgi:hypothetical protein